jgi:hypothetical protein
MTLAADRRSFVRLADVLGVPPRLRNCRGLAPLPIDPLRILGHELTGGAIDHRLKLKQSSVTVP